MRRCLPSRVLCCQIFCCVGLYAGALSAAMAVEPVVVAESPSQNPAKALVAFGSNEGMARLVRSNAKVDFPDLANQFESQSNGFFCGPTSAAIVLNAIFHQRLDLPRDRSRLSTWDLQHIPSTVDPTLPRFTQDNVISKGSKTRAQVFGEPLTIDGQLTRDGGYQIRQLDEMLAANGVATRLTIVDDAAEVSEIRKALVNNLRRQGDYVIVAYQRSAAGQNGGGHISPLAAYDEESDSFLVLDVNPSKASWVWMPATALIKGMRTFDRVENRGFIEVMPK